MRSIVGIVLSLLAQLSVAELSLGQKVLKENPYYLRGDARLQVFLNVEPEHPTLSQIIARLHEATGLDLTIAENLRHHQPDYGHIQPSTPGYRAWQIMEMVSKRKLEDGHWEKTDQGYRLVGTSLLPDPKVVENVSPSTRRWWVIAALLVLLVAFSAVATLRIRRSRWQSPKS